MGIIIMQGMPSTKITLLLCGSFNPPTIMHRRMLHVAKHKFEQLGYRNIHGIVSPVHDAYNKPNLVSMTHRFEMAKLAFSDDSWIIVSDWEINQPGWTSTRCVLQHFKDEQESTAESVKLALVCGGDVLLSMTNPSIWPANDVNHLLSQTQFIILTRNAINTQECSKIIDSNDVLRRQKDNIIVVEELFGGLISSTKVRESLENGYSVIDIINPKVLNYIKVHKLYNVK